MGKIDYVVPMVFTNDAYWRQDFWNTCSFYSDEHVRWRSWGTEELLIQLVRKNMPWLGTIYILLSRKSQLRDWMNIDGVKVVYHEEFIEREYLPTFNSCTIEMFLHRIPGLSEYFIYGNDDMFPLSPLEEDDFFVNGKPCQHMIEVPFPPKPNTFHKSCMNGQRFIAEKCGIAETGKWFKNGHSIAPILKSTCEKVWEIGGKEIKNSISALRNEKNFSQYIYSWWQHYTGNYIDKIPQLKYLNAGDVSAGELQYVIGNTQGILCINDTRKVENYKMLAKAVVESLKKRVQA